MAVGYLLFFLLGGNTQAILSERTWDSFRCFCGEQLAESVHNAGNKLAWWLLCSVGRILGDLWISNKEFVAHFREWLLWCLSVLNLQINVNFLHYEAASLRVSHLSLINRHFPPTGKYSVPLFTRWVMGKLTINKWIITFCVSTWFAELPVGSELQYWVKVIDHLLIYLISEKSH